VGRRQHLRISYGGHRASVDLEITEWEPEARIAWSHVADRIEGMETQVARDVRVRITLAPAAGGTAVSFEASWEPVGFVGRMVSGTLLKSRVTSMFEQEARNLERLAREEEGGS
jgi:carbon monoxide dehydrogenase subunit G